MSKADPLTPQERAEVLARVKAKDVTVCPAGRTSFEYPKWDGKKLVTPEGENGFRASMGRFHGRNSQKKNVRRRAVTPPLSPEIIGRRNEVAKLHAKGAAMAEILASIPGSTAATTRHDLHILGLTPHPRVHPQEVDHSDRERQIREMCAKGCTAHEVARALPLHVDTVRKLAKSFGLTFPRKVRSDANDRGCCKKSCGQSAGRTGPKKEISMNDLPPAIASAPDLMQEAAADGAEATLAGFQAWLDANLARARRDVLVQAIGRVPPRDACTIMAAALDDLGAGMPAADAYFQDLRSDAAFWADSAAPTELEAYAAAALRRIERVCFAVGARKRLIVALWGALPDADRRAFLAAVDPDGKFRGARK